jgi:hypothetical protein
MTKGNPLIEILEGASYNTGDEMEESKEEISFNRTSNNIM